MGKRQENMPDSKTLTITVSRDMYHGIKKLAEIKGISMSKLVADILWREV